MRENGFTLIEVILVIVILAIAVPGLISTVAFMTKGQMSATGTTTGGMLAQERMEQIVADKQNPARGFAFVVNANYPDESPVAGFANYNRTVSIDCVLPADLNTSVACPTDYKRVQVTVQAVGLGPNVPDASLVTLVTNH